MPTVLFIRGWQLFFYTDECYLYIKVDDQLYRVTWQMCSPKLMYATHDERSFFRISPSGYGIHWPLVDEDLAINPLLKIAEKLIALPIMATEAVNSV